MEIRDLPALNAALNATSAVLLLLAFAAIRRGDVHRHRALMLSAVGVSVVFLASYLTYHFQHGSTKFTATGWPRALYFSVLISHTVLAAALVPMVVVTLRRGLARRDEAHRRIARWTWPVWLYVSVTGVLIYFMLYQWFPPLNP